MEKKTKGFGSKLGSLLKKGALVGGVALAGIGAAAVKMGLDFEKSMAEVKTLMPEVSEKAFGQMRKDTIALSKEIGIATNKTVPALYQAISAGIPRENVMEFMQVASKAAIGGVTDLETVVDGLTTITNAWGLESREAGRIADIMFTGVKLGKTTMEELSRSMFQAAPLAAALGISIEEVVSSTATLTKSGVPTAIAMTQMRQAMVALTKPTADMAKLLAETGFASGEALIKAKGFTGALEFLTKAADGNKEVMGKAFGSVEALGFVLGVTGENAAVAAEDLAAVTDSAGAADKAFETMEKTTSRKLAKSLNELNIMMMELGTEILPLIVPAMRAVVFMAGTLAEALRAIIAPIKAIADLIDTAFGKMPAPVEMATRVLVEMAGKAEITKGEFVKLAEGIGLTTAEARKLADDTAFPSQMEVWKQKALDFGLATEEVDRLWKEAANAYGLTAGEIATETGRMVDKARELAEAMDEAEGGATDLDPAVQNLKNIISELATETEAAREALLGLFKDPTVEEVKATAALKTLRLEEAQLIDQAGPMTDSIKERAEEIAGETGDVEALELQLRGLSDVEIARLSLLQDELIPEQEDYNDVLRLQRDELAAVTEANVTTAASQEELEEAVRLGSETFGAAQIAEGAAKTELANYQRIVQSSIPEQNRLTESLRAATLVADPWVKALQASERELLTGTKTADAWITKLRSVPARVSTIWDIAINPTISLLGFDITAQQRQLFAGAQHGFHGMVTGPQGFFIEPGKTERVDITPQAQVVRDFIRAPTAPIMSTVGGEPNIIERHIEVNVTDGSPAAIANAVKMADIELGLRTSAELEALA